MFSEAIELQPFAARILKAHLQKGRLSHAYMLAGAAAPGKESLALAFAAAMNCVKEKYFEECACVSCHKVYAHHHPDVMTLGEDESARAIKIEEVREVIAAAGLKPYEGKRKVFIVKGSERLTIESSNALLKTLEEPPDHTIFILMAESREGLIETIQSRCFEIRLRPSDVKNENAELVQDIKAKNWEDLLEDYASSTRAELGRLFDDLISYFRSRMEDPVASGQLASLIKAIEFLIESKDALDSNVNSKLILTHLAMQLRRNVPQTSL